MAETSVVLHFRCRCSPPNVKMGGLWRRSAIFAAPARKETGGPGPAQGNEAALMAVVPGPENHRGPAGAGHEEAGTRSSGLAIGKWLRFQMLAALALAAVAAPIGVTPAYSSF
jgi:hypothetical protein